MQIYFYHITKKNLKYKLYINDLMTTLMSDIKANNIFIKNKKVAEVQNKSQTIVGNNNNTTNTQIKIEIQIINCSYNENKLPNMNSNYISTESINNMNITDLVHHIQEFVFFERKTMKEGKYKNTQDMLKRLYEIGQKKTFEGQCKKYSVFFVEVCPVINLPLSGRSICHGLGNCCRATEVRIKSKGTAIKNVSLHPILVDFLNSSEFFWHDPWPSGCEFNVILGNFLMERGDSYDSPVRDVSFFVHLLCTQFNENIRTIIAAAETKFEFSEKTRCGSNIRSMDENGEFGKSFKVEKTLILTKILKMPENSVSVSN